MKTTIIIPARYASTRYPGKPLALLRDGAGVAKTLVQRSWEAAQAVQGVADVYVATDDARIADHARDFGADVILTSVDCENGTMRCADACRQAGLTADLIINLQGDAPLTPRWFVEALMAEAARDGSKEVLTPVVRCDPQTYGHFRSDRQAGLVGGTTAVFARDGRALYFSKEVIPYIDLTKESDAYANVFHHVGLYAYRPEALAHYAHLPSGPLERLEGLEQLRFMENNIEVHCVEVEPRGAVFWELNNPQDIPRIEQILAQQK